MLNNIKDFGAIGDGVTDDRAYIQNAINDAVSNNKGGILIPSGTYRVSKSPIPGVRCSIDLNGVQDFMIMGEGPKSVVKLVDTTSATGDWHVFILRNKCQRMVIKDLVIDGNRTGLTDPDEQSHGIEVEPGTEDLVVERCTLRECFGDGMRLLGKDGPEQNVKRLRIENCLFQTNKRSGLAIQRAIEQIIIANCIFDATVTDQSIDFEPTGTDGPTDLIIQGCLINHTNGTAAVTLSGIGSRHPLLRCKFSDNIVLGGQIFCTDVTQLAIQNNIIVSPKRSAIAVNRGGEECLITGNMIVHEQPDGGAAISLTEANQRQVTRALIAHNLCLTRSGTGILCRSSDDVAVENNMIVATGPCDEGIFVHSENSSMDNISLRDNDILVKDEGTWVTGIRLSSGSAKPIHHISVVGNAVSGAKKGVAFENRGFAQTPICALNRISENVPEPLSGLDNLPFGSLITGGALSRGGSTPNSGAGRFLTGLGDPNKKVPGNVGDLFQRLDGTPGATFFVKETGSNTKSGWVAK